MARHRDPNRDDFGFSSPQARRQADLFYADLFGRSPRRRRRRAEGFSSEEGGAGVVEDLVPMLLAEATSSTPYMVLEDFPFDDDTVPSSHRAAIARVAHLVLDSLPSAEPITEVRLVGHTDSVGGSTGNVTLGRRRAAKVEALLVSEMDARVSGASSGVTRTVQSRGEAAPIDTNATTAGRARNRRVEIFVASTCHAFLAQYDLRSLPRSADFGVPANPALNAAQKAQREADVGAVIGTPTDGIVDRRDARTAAAVTGSTGTVPAARAVTAALRPSAERLSAFQLDLFREFMPDGSGGIDFDRVRTCMEGFANGELRSAITRSIAEPNGGFFFLFAEFAFLCIDSGIEAATWTDLARIFVMAQELFIPVYRPAAAVAPAPRALDTFHFRNFDPAGQASAAQKTTLRGRYAGIALSAIRTAARDNLRRAVTTP